MGMTGAEMLQELRDQLNEPVANFWTDAQLYRYLTRAARDLLSAWQRHHSLIYSQAHDYTYPAATASHNSTVGTGDAMITRVLRVEDVSNPNDPIELEPAESLDHLRDLQVAEGTPTHYLVSMAENSSAMVVSTLLAPRPTEQITLRIFYSPDWREYTISASTTDTILMSQHESAIILKAAIRASMQDQNNALTSELRREFAQVERESRLMNMPDQGTEGVRYDYSDF